MLRLSNFSYAWSTSAADINRDGILDVVAGPLYFLGPDFTVSREIALSQTGSPEQRVPERAGALRVRLDRRRLAGRA